MITDKLKDTLRDAIMAFVDDVLIDARRAPVRDRVRLAVTMYSETSDQVESFSFEIGELADSLARSIQQAEDFNNVRSPTIVVNHRLWAELVASHSDLQARVAAFTATSAPAVDVASTITRCGICKLAAHASETNDAGNHPDCEPKSA